jgi:hypothetical protein
MVKCGSKLPFVFPRFLDKFFEQQIPNAPRRALGVEVPRCVPTKEWKMSSIVLEVMNGL